MQKTRLYFSLLPGKVGQDTVRGRQERRRERERERKRTTALGPGAWTMVPRIFFLPFENPPFCLLSLEPCPYLVSVIYRKKNAQSFSAPRVCVHVASACSLVCVSLLLTFVVSLFSHRGAEKRKNTRSMLLRTMKNLGPVGDDRSGEEKKMSQRTLFRILNPEERAFCCG